VRQVGFPLNEYIEMQGQQNIKFRHAKYEGWNFNSGNYLFTTDTK